MKIKKLTVELLLTSGIPNKFWPLGVDSFQGDENALRICHNYARKFLKAYSKGTGLLIFGPSNTFKTFLATYVLKCLLLRDLTVRFLSFDALTSAFVNKSLDGLLSNDVHCVVFDGVATPFNQESRSAFHRAVLSRSDSGLPYIITTTFLNRQSWESRYSPRVCSRIGNDLIEIPSGDLKTALNAGSLADDNKETIAAYVR